MAFPTAIAIEEEEKRAAIPGGRYITGLEKLNDENSPLSDEQLSEYGEILRLTQEEDKRQTKHPMVTDTVLRRELHVHTHSALGKERTADVIIARKAPSMARHEIRVLLLNLNFFKRLHTLALYKFMTEDVLEGEEKRDEVRQRIELMIQEEEADDVDIKMLIDKVDKYTGEAPLIVLTDETCKEVERLDDAISQLADPYNYYHFWSCSVFAHGTPLGVPRFRPFTRDYTRRVKEVIDLIDIDDEDQDAAEPRHLAVRQIDPPVDMEQEEGYNIREHLRTLPVYLISHIEHKNPDVWDCHECGDLLAKYLRDEIGLGKEGLKPNEVFIVGSIERFQSSIQAQKFLGHLMNNEIAVEVAFGRRLIRIEEKIMTMKNVVLSDNISMRGVDKKIVIIVPSHGEEAHKQRDKDRERMEMKMEKVAKEQNLDRGTVTQDPPKDSERDEMEEPMDVDSAGEGQQNVQKTQLSPATKQSLLRRAVNHYNRADKDLILDMLKDAPDHAVLFHFANEQL